jgi:hypothetical protein
MKIMSTHGIVPGSGCHYEPLGYQVFSDLIGPLVEQDVYGVMPTAKLTAPNLQQAYFTTPAKTEIALVFDQNITWHVNAPTLLFLDNAAGATSGSVSSGSATGNTIKLQVSGATNAATITYLKGLFPWVQADILKGTNNIAALTFADVPIGTADTTPPTPNPMTFATPPAALGETSITMTATTASDPSGVEYFFECTAGGGHSSAWQDSPTYTDTGLTAATQYSYRVRARDKSAAQTVTAWSAAASATTPNTPYGTWSGGAAFDGDANNDGVDNGMAWLLGAADSSENAAGKLPKATRNGANLRLAFRCLKSTGRGGVVLKVQTSSDLGLAAPWTNHEAAVPDEDATVNGVIFDITDDGDYIHVIADIPVGGAKLFGRLSAVNAQ